MLTLYLRGGQIFWSAGRLKFFFALRATLLKTQELNINYICHKTQVIKLKSLLRRPDKRPRRVVLCPPLLYLLLLIAVTKSIIMMLDVFVFPQFVIFLKLNGSV